MKLIAKTLYGLEKVLAEELSVLGASGIQIANRAVVFNGDMSLLYKVNYCARTALSVLYPVAEFRIRSKDDLYREGSHIKWDKYLSDDGTFSVSPVVNSKYFDHTGYAGLLLKDAVADFFRNKSGRRPSVNSDDPDVLINLHISNETVTVSLDSSVIPLFKRGYRTGQTVAPLNEVLAAGILLLSGWKASVSLTDPMCGSGTIPLEAALIAGKIPPGRYRKSFGFRKWKTFDEDLFRKIKQAADSDMTPSPVKIYASDISEDALKIARSNIENAGLTEFITLKQADFAELQAADDNGFIFLNPPYGQRIKTEEIDALYTMIGTRLKHVFAGSTAWIITSNRESAKNIGLKPKEKHTLYNGALECVLLKYELYQGSKKQRGNDIII